VRAGVIAADPANAAEAMARVADAVTHCKFEASDAVSDEVVLMKILQVPATPGAWLLTGSPASLMPLPLPLPPCLPSGAQGMPAQPVRPAAHRRGGVLLYGHLPVHLIPNAAQRALAVAAAAAHIVGAVAGPT